MHARVFYLVNIHLSDIVVLDCIPPKFIAHTTGMTHFLDMYLKFNEMSPSFSFPTVYFSSLKPGNIIWKRDSGGLK